MTVLAATFAGCSLAESKPAPNLPPSTQKLREVRLRSSAEVAAGGDAISAPGFSTEDWVAATLPTTVLGALVNAGQHPNVLRSTNLSNVDPGQFRVPWWFRAKFTHRAKDPANAFVTIPGAISRAEVWVNGHRLGEVAGAYTDTEFDVSPYQHVGTNALALRVDPADIHRDLAISFLDWAQHPPDASQGIWRNIEVRREGAVSLRNPFVRTKLALPGLSRADLTVSVDVRNNGASARRVEVGGTADDLTVGRLVRLQPHETRRVTFSHVLMQMPRVWWPSGMGDQPLYELDLHASVGGKSVATVSTRFGVRDVQGTVTPAGDRQYSINGVPLLIRGAGWAPDLFLREDAARWEAELRYAKDVGLNAVRLEGKLADDAFYDLADRLGIFVIAGWECCSKWESWTGFLGEPWSAGDREIARQSIASQAVRLRTHPSVLTFLLGSDTAPPADVQQIYLDELHNAQWPDVIDLGATKTDVAPFGPSHIQFGGPYDWVPPVYWYEEALGFSMEQGTGKSIPMIDTLKQMLSPEEMQQLWQKPADQQFHMGYTGELATFADALSRRYGGWNSLEGFAERAYLANYESARAQFEAYARNRMRKGRTATGTVYWMLNSSWPSLNWQLFDYSLRPTAAYFGAKKANEAHHVQFSYDDRTVVAVNRTRASLKGATVEAHIIGMDGTEKWHAERGDVDVAPGTSVSVLTVPVPTPVVRTYVLRLRLRDHAGKVLSTNTYWLSNSADTVDRSHADPDGFPWSGIGLGQAADFSALATSPKASVEASLRRDSATSAVVRLRNRSTTVALAVEAILRSRDGRVIAPVRWSDNMVTLLPGEDVSLTVRFDNGVAADTVSLTGLNLADQQG